MIELSTALETMPLRAIELLSNALRLLGGIVVWGTSDILQNTTYILTIWFVTFCLIRWKFDNKTFNVFRYHEILGTSLFT